MSVRLAALCLTCWLIGACWGFYKRERYGADRCLREILLGRETE